MLFPLIFKIELLFKSLSINNEGLSVDLPFSSRSSEGLHYLNEVLDGFFWSLAIPISELDGSSKKLKIFKYYVNKFL